MGKIGGVNQALEGLQNKYGELRISDTGIREATIIGQGIGLAMRGLRPIAEIQYFDYLLYGLQLLSDDLATLRYRSRGTQKAPANYSYKRSSTRRNLAFGLTLKYGDQLRKRDVCLVPRDMTQAAGFYNTMIVSDDPALIIEPLNAYRIREKLPSNIGEFRVIPGKAEILSVGKT